MRTIALLFSLSLLCACTSSEACHTIPLGADITSFKRSEVTINSDPVMKAMLEPASNAMYGRDTKLVWDNGPVASSVCCATKAWGQPRAWCSAEQLECTTPESQGITLFTLAAPYSDDSRAPDDASYCYVAVRENRIIAIWHRLWS